MTDETSELAEAIPVADATAEGAEARLVAPPRRGNQSGLGSLCGRIGDGDRFGELAGLISHIPTISVHVK